MSSIATTQSALAVGFSFPIINAVLVGLRFYTRRHLKNDLQVDDWLCVPAWLCLTGCCASLLTGVFKDAFGEAAVNDPQHRTEKEHILAQVTAALVIFWMGANFFIKLVMLFFYRRIFVGKTFMILNRILIALSFLWFVYAIISWLFYCGLNFEANVEGGWLVCPQWGFEIQMGVFALDSFIDLGLLILPMPFVWRLQLDLKRKVVIVVVFFLGGFAFVAGLNNTIIQLVYLTEPSVAESGGGANFFQGSSLLFSNWPAIEIGVALIASNLPHLSFRLIRILSQSLPHFLRVSFNSLRNAAAAISLRSLRNSQGSGHRGRTSYETRHQQQQDAAESSQNLQTRVEPEGSDDAQVARSLAPGSGKSRPVTDMNDLEANIEAW